FYTSRTNNARLEGGCLIIEARQENWQGSNYTSARLKTQGKASWLYGRFEARIQIPRGQGIWPAFWMLGTNITSVGWPNCGEIDIMENIGREPNIVHGTVHGPGYSGGGGISGAYTLPGGVAFADDFHVFAVEWTTNRIEWFVDGQRYFTVTPTNLPSGAPWVFDRPQFLLLNVAVGGNWPGYPDGTTMFPQRMRVDYVRVFARTNLPPCPGNLLSNGGFETGALAPWTAYGAGFNTLVASTNSVPVRTGGRAFKVFGQFNGQENYSGAFQDVPASAGQRFTARGWACTPSGDAIAGANSAWLEVSFRDGGGTMLRLFRSDTVRSNSPAGVWLPLVVTNEFDPVTHQFLGTVSGLEAPPGTSFVRVQMVFRQPGLAAGAVVFDDLELGSAGAPVAGVPVSAVLDGNQVALGFETFLGPMYQVQTTTNLALPDWVSLTNVPGSGLRQTVRVGVESFARFFRAVRLCE
ncbi:MAG: family 16 glycosylhydrolase, partial [Verrucomicrobiales bacterium]|nr:family 16 glycosylhydrolase [Verrucomicrobiales bacterium]